VLQKAAKNRRRGRDAAAQLAVPPGRSWLAALMEPVVYED